MTDFLPLFAIAVSVAAVTFIFTLSLTEHWEKQRNLEREVRALRLENASLTRDLHVVHSGKSEEWERMGKDITSAKEEINFLFSKLFIDKDSPLYPLEKEGATND